ncbi:MAG: hypothetical protein PVG03_18775 [Desulfarculaceae bacterium]|jgi:hypothetical protein
MSTGFVIKPILAGLLGLGLILANNPAEAGFLDDMKQIGGSIADRLSDDYKDMKKQINKDFGSEKEKASSQDKPKAQKAKAEKKSEEKVASSSGSQAGSTSKGDQDAATLLKQAEKGLRQAEKLMHRGKTDQALEEADKVQELIDQAEEIDPKHKRLKTVKSKLAKLQKDLARRTKTAAPKAAKPAPKPAAAPTQAAKAKAAPATAKPAQTAKLPGGVTSRLKKLHRELDKAERVLAGSSAQDWKAKQAGHHLKAAQTYIAEIEKGYSDKAPADHPEMQKAQERIQDIEAKVGQLGKKVASAQAEKDKAAQKKQSSANLSKDWAQKLKPYITDSSGKALLVYPTDDAALWQKRKKIYDELAPLWEEYQKTEFPGGKSMELKGIEQQLARYVERYKKHYQEWEAKQKQAAADLGRIVFSTSPIDPAKPAGLSNSFQAGDHIYALIQAKKSWREIYRAKQKADVSIQTMVDGKKIHAQFIILTKPEDLDKKYLLFEVAPDPGKMQAYSKVTYGESKPNLKQGPMEMTLHLSKLGPGKHKLEFKIAYFRKDYAKGGFEIQGKDFGSYAKLHEQVKAAMTQTVTLPKAKMVNKKMEAEMKALLKNAGWPDIYRLNIIDKDWWIDRVSGGNSPIKSRHLAAAALAKDSDGTYYYRVATFHQPRLITGGYGKLELTHTGAKRKIPKENIDK